MTLPSFPRDAPEDDDAPSSYCSGRLEMPGAPSMTRTCDLQVRNLALYPTELWARGKREKRLPPAGPSASLRARARRARERANARSGIARPARSPGRSRSRSRSSSRRSCSPGRGWRRRRAPDPKPRAGRRRPSRGRGSTGRRRSRCRADVVVDAVLALRLLARRGREATAGIVREVDEAVAVVVDAVVAGLVTICHEKVCGVDGRAVRDARRDGEGAAAVARARHGAGLAVQHEAGREAVASNQRSSPSGSVAPKVKLTGWPGPFVSMPGFTRMGGAFVSGTGTVGERRFAGIGCLAMPGPLPAHRERLLAGALEEADLDRRGTRPRATPSRSAPPFRAGRRCRRRARRRSRAGSRRRSSCRTCTCPRRRCGPRRGSGTRSPRCAAGRRCRTSRPCPVDRREQSRSWGAARPVSSRSTRTRRPSAGVSGSTRRIHCVEHLDAGRVDEPLRERRHGERRAAPCRRGARRSSGPGCPARRGTSWGCRGCRSPRP